MQTDTKPLPYVYCVVNEPVCTSVVSFLIPFLQNMRSRLCAASSGSKFIRRVSSPVKLSKEISVLLQVLILLLRLAY